MQTEIRKVPTRHTKKLHTRLPREVVESPSFKVFKIGQSPQSELKQTKKKSKFNFNSGLSKSLDYHSNPHDYELKASRKASNKKIF